MTVALERALHQLWRVHSTDQELNSSVPPTSDSLFEQLLCLLEQGVMKGWRTSEKLQQLTHLFRSYRSITKQGVWRTADPMRIHLQPWLCTSAVHLWLLHLQQRGNSEINCLIKSNTPVIFSVHILICLINGIYLWIYKLVFVFSPYLAINKENFEYCKERNVWRLIVSIEGELCV